MITNSRLQEQINFLLELDKLKAVLRRNQPVGGSRYEDSAQHSWHLTIMALVLAEHAPATVNIGRVMQMVLIHDIVEIDAGDTYLYDEAARRAKQIEEEAAAARIFGLLPADQAEPLHALWREFEARQSNDARFAYALDRLLPLLQNFHNAGSNWQENDVHQGQVWKLNQPIGDSSPALWAVAEALINSAVDRGYLAPAPPDEC